MDSSIFMAGWRHFRIEYLIMKYEAYSFNYTYRTDYIQKASIHSLTNIYWTYDSRTKYTFRGQPEESTPANGQPPDIYLLTADVSESWDWRTNISLRESQITASSSKNGFPPQAVQNAALFSGSLTDPQFYLYGGSTTNINSSFPDLLPQPAQGHYLCV